MPNNVMLCQKFSPLLDPDVSEVVVTPDQGEATTFFRFR